MDDDRKIEFPRQAQLALEEMRLGLVIEPLDEIVQSTLADGNGLRAGALGDAHLGIQPRIFRFEGRAGQVELRIYAESGVEISTHPGASQWVTDGGARLESSGPVFPLVGRPRISGGLGATARVHAQGEVLEPHAEVSLGTDLLEGGAEWRAFHGRLPNHVLYNDPSTELDDGGNDDVAGFFVRTRF